MGKPDVRGRSRVTVTNGDGEQKEYTVDFADAVAQPDEIEAVDGVAVIQDEDAEITIAKVPGSADRFRMTVDDGTPESYDLDFGSAGETPDGFGSSGAAAAPPSAVTGGGLQPGRLVGAGTPVVRTPEPGPVAVGGGSGADSPAQRGGMVGGMPTAPTSGAQSGDQTRLRKWRTTSQEFEVEDQAVNFAGVIGREKTPNS